MKKYIPLILALIMVFALTACADDTKDTAAPVETEEMSENESSTFTISAGGLKLKYPTKWKDKVTVNVTDDRACFACGDTKLFDLVFNKNEGNILGTVKGEEYVVIYVKDYPVENQNEELLLMQEDINVIIDNLCLDYDFSVGASLEKENVPTFDIETSVVTMKYPEKWKDKVSVDVSDDCVKFSSNGTPLFDLAFSECDGYLLGRYNNTPIYIVNYSTENEEFLLMQEDVNVILQYLMEDSNFEIAK